MTRRIPTVQGNWRPGLLDELQTQVADLEGMLCDPGLSRTRARFPDHPAVRRHEVLSGLLTNAGRYDTAKEDQVFLALAGSMIDRLAWNADSENVDWWAFVPQRSAREWLRAQMQRPNSFEPAVSELFFWGWLLRRGFEVDLVEADGLPDLRIRTPGGLVWADVKRVKTDSQTRRIRKDIADVNEKIKRADETGVGVAFVHVDRNCLPTPPEDRVPPDVGGRVTAAVRELGSNSSRSVGQVVMTWDDFWQLGQPERRTMYVVRRRSLVIRHAHPRYPPLLDDSALAVGATVEAWGNRTRS